MHRLPTQSTRLNDAAEGDPSELQTTQMRTEAGRTNAGCLGLAEGAARKELSSMQVPGENAVCAICMHNAAFV